MTGPDRRPPIDADATMIIPRADAPTALATPDPDATAMLPAIADDRATGVHARIDGTPSQVEASQAEGESTIDPEHRNAAGNSASMALGSLVSRGTGFLRTAVMASALGVGLIGNAYTTAQIFPGMIYELLLGGILSSVLVPMLVRSRKNDADRGAAFTQRLLTLTVIVLGVTTVLAVLCAPLLSLVYAGSSEPGNEAYRGVITALSYLMLPTIFFYGLTGICSAVLNTRGQFAAPMWTPILNNLVVIATGGLYLVMFGTTPVTTADEVTPERILVLGGGVLLGIVVQAGGLLPALRRTGFRWKLRFDFRELGLRHLARVGGWMFFYVIINQLALMVLTNLLNRAGHGNAGPMIYNNVFLLMMMAHGIIVVSIITALLPRMSHAAADGKAADIAADLRRGIRMVVVVLTPIAVCYAVLSLPIAITLFERGAIGRDASLATAPVLAMAGVALVPFAISQLFNFTYYSMQDTRTPALINLPVASLRVSVQLGWWAAFSASLVAAGMMVGNGISYLLGAVLSAALLRRRIGLLGLSSIAVTAGKVLVASIVAGAAGFGVVQLVYAGVPRSGITHVTAWLALIVGGLVICGVYGVLAMLLKIREVSDVLGMVRRRLGR